jgi:hypothetical protein
MMVPDTFMFHAFTRLAIIGLFAFGVSACSFDVRGTTIVNNKVNTVRAGTQKPVLLPDGQCEASASLDLGSLQGRPITIMVGISECDLVRIKAKPPTDVLIGESGKGQRETQVLYAEAGGRELYFFTDNVLVRVVK